MMEGMAEGEGVADQGIRVRLDARASRSDISALKAWLEREKVLEGLRIVERPRGDAPDGHMGVAMEIWLAVVSSTTTIAVSKLLDQTARAVQAWRANRREVESGEPPEASVDPVNLDER